MMPPTATCCSTRACTALTLAESVDVARHVDLLVGVVPIVNLEWIQKLHRDRHQRGYSQDAVVDTILRRMPDYVNHICPQFSARMSTSSACRRGHQQPIYRADIPTCRRVAWW